MKEYSIRLIGLIILEFVFKSSVTLQIKLLRRDQIDDSLWNARVVQSGNGLPYALADYLDIVTDKNWSALVGDNYEAIFPLPFEKKLGLTMYLQPPFSQQLGLIANEFSRELEIQFLNSVPNNVAAISLKGNERSSIESSIRFDVYSRTNFVLPLTRDYKSININYSKSLRKRVKKSRSLYRIEKSIDVALIVSFYQREMKERVSLNDDQYGIARKLMSYLLKENLGTIFLARNGNNIEGALFVIRFQNRLINLFGTSNADGKNNHAMHFILDHIVESNCDSDKVLDFEGSDLKGVKEFYQSFGPTELNYPEYQFDNLPLWFRILKGMKNVISK